MNERIQNIAYECGLYSDGTPDSWDMETLEKFAELIIRECLDREELLGAIARGWCSEENSHKIVDPVLGLAIFNEIEKYIKNRFGGE